MSVSTNTNSGAARLGQILVEKDLLKPESLRGLLADIQGLNIDLPLVLDKRGLVTESETATAISEVLSIPLVETIGSHEILTNIKGFSWARMDATRSIPIKLIQNGALPRIQLVMSNPFSLKNLDDLSGKMTFELCVAPSSAIRAALDEITEAAFAKSKAELTLEYLLNAGVLTQTQIEWAESQLVHLSKGKHSQKPVSKVMESNTPGEHL